MPTGFLKISSEELFTNPLKVMLKELSGYKKTPVPNRGFIPGHLRSYNLFGPDSTNVIKTY